MLTPLYKKNYPFIPIDYQPGYCYFNKALMSRELVIGSKIEMLPIWGYRNEHVFYEVDSRP